MRGLTQRGSPVHFKLEDAWATKYVGVPYVPGGRTIKGFDCWGLIHLIWSNEYGTELAPEDNLGLQGLFELGLSQKVLLDQKFAKPDGHDAFLIKIIVKMSCPPVVCLPS